MHHRYDATLWNVHATRADMKATMTEIAIRKEGAAGCITLNRPKALNALTHDMCIQIYDALTTWIDDSDVAAVMIDAEGDKAFCAGGDIAKLYASGIAGDHNYGRQFWRDEYRLNDLIAGYPKPIVSFLQGFTMGGGVGVGCHGSHRIVGETSQIAMPECSIGLVPDVGGSFLLGHAPGHTGAYLGVLGARMNAADAIFAGFADLFVPQAHWPDMKSKIVETGDVTVLDALAADPPKGPVEEMRQQIDALFHHVRLADLAEALRADDSTFAQDCLKKLIQNAPIAMGCALWMLNGQPAPANVRDALQQEYRTTFRATEQGDLLEGIRAAIIDRDRNPSWQHRIDTLTDSDVAAMLAPLGRDELNLKGRTP